MLSSGFLKTSDNKNISYDHYNNGNEKVAVIVHGFFNSKESTLLSNLASNLSLQYDVFMFDFRGHGKSSGLFTWTSTEDRDLKRVLTYLDGQYQKTAIIAFSMGGSVSVNVLAELENRADSFVCISAPSDCSKIDYKLWKLDLENDIYYSFLMKDGRKGKGCRPGPFWLSKQKPIDNIDKLKMPILYIHGDKDWVIDEWHSRKLYEKTISQKRLIIIENGPHAEYLLRKFPDKILIEIKDWLKDTL